MTTVLFVGGVSPDLTLEDLGYAFSQHHVELLASSIVCVKAEGGAGEVGGLAGKCVGQAYVTVRSEDVPRALAVCQVGANGVCVLPVDVKAWVKPEVAEAVVTAAMTAVPAAHVAAMAPPPSSSATAGAVPPTAPISSALGVGGVGPSLEPSGVRGGGGGPAPSTSSQSGGGGRGGGPAPSATSLAQLQAVMDQLRTHLAVNPWLSYNGKPHFTLLHEACQKRQLNLQVVESLGSVEGSGGPFVSTITAATTTTGEVMCTGCACGSSKRDAKHNAAAACLEQMLVTGMVPPTELLSAMTCQGTNPSGAAAAAAAGGGGGGGGGIVAAAPPSTAALLDGVGGFGVAVSPAAKSAVSLTNEIMQLGPYPRCEEVMRQVYGTDQGRLKTVLMVLNEYATRARMAIQHQQVPLPHAGLPGSPGCVGGRFKFRSILVNSVTGQVMAQADGAELRSKQEAKQAAAAALIEHLLAHNLATAEALRGGK